MADVVLTVTVPEAMLRKMIKTVGGVIHDEAAFLAHIQTEQFKEDLDADICMAWDSQNDDNEGDLSDVVASLFDETVSFPDIDD